MYKKSLLIIGAGPTSALIAYNIRRCTSLNQITDIHVWDKARGSGGRFSTTRSPANNNCSADLGAQYLTQSQKWSEPYFKSLLEAGDLLCPLNTSNIPGFREDLPDKKNYTCRRGTGAVVKHIFEQLAEFKTISFNSRVTSLTPILGSNQNKVEVQTEDGKVELFDIVISTIPVPLVLQLENVDRLLLGKRDLKTHLQSVKYTSRYAVGLFYDEKVKVENSDEGINFVDNNSVIRYWSLENIKRGAETPDNSSSIVVHTSTDFGAQHIDEELESVKPLLLEKVNEEIKTDIKPNFVKCHKWRYSQVSKPYPESPGFVVVQKVPLIIVSGDGMAYSGFEGCIHSAEKTVQHLRTVLTNNRFFTSNLK